MIDTINNPSINYAQIWEGKLNIQLKPKIMFNDCIIVEICLQNLSKSPPEPQGFCGTKLEYNLARKCPPCLMTFECTVRV